jgi:hypothetical protein
MGRISFWDVNVVGQNIDAIKKITEALLVTSKEAGLGVNPGITKNILMSRNQKLEQKHSIKIAHRSFEVVAKFKYLETTLTVQSFVHEEIKGRLISGNACHRSVQSVLSSRLLSKNVKLKYTKP